MDFPCHIGAIVRIKRERDVYNKVVKAHWQQKSTVRTLLVKCDIL